MTARRTIVATLLALTTYPGAPAMTPAAEERPRRSEPANVCREDTLEAIHRGDGDAVAEHLARDPELAQRRTPDGVSLLLFALYNGRTEIAEALRQHRTVLDRFEAAALGDVQELRRALDAEPAAVDERAADGFTALHLAAFFGQGRSARVLLAAGADVEASASGGSLRPLHSAAASRRAAMVRILLGAGADPDARQAGGFTALHSAAKHENLAMAVALLAHGADPAVEADDGKDALAFAREADAKRMERLIRSHGVD